MRSYALFFILGTFLFFSSFSTYQNPDGRLFEWFLGTWEGPSGNGTYIEKWTENKKGQFEGEAYLIMPHDTVLKEELYIHNFGGYWNFIAIVNGGKPTMFTLVDTNSSTYVFENKEHDFPQRVVYNRTTANKLSAWVEGDLGGKNVKEEFFLNKVKD